jgi:hypothetical protein
MGLGAEGVTRPSLFRDLARVCRTDAEHSPSMAQWDHLHEVAQRWDARADALEEELLLGPMREAG